MNEPKVIVLDIDGTLFDDEKKIQPKTKEFLIKAQEKGNVVVLASGRPASGLWYIAEELKMSEHHGLLCCFNGSQVVDCTTTDILYNTPVDINKGREVLKHLRKFDVTPMLYKDAYLYVENAYAPKVEYESRLCKMMVCEVNDLAAFLNWGTNKILTAGDPVYLEKHAKEMAAPFKDQLNCMFTAPFYFEFTEKGIDKAKALDVALKKLGYTANDCIAFGDAENDLSIIKFAKTGVAMGNATDEVKNAADYVTQDNNHEGIYNALKKYMPSLLK